MRTYSLVDLEDSTALSRRTIGDYVAKGLLNGPSHRGRGARYPQRDLDALRVIPMLRTMLKAEFPNLGAVRQFLTELSMADFRHLARLSNELTFEIEVRRLRIRNRLRTFFPAVAPERIIDRLRTLTPEQVRGVDRGQLQIGAVLDMTLLGEESSRASDVIEPPAFERHDVSRNGGYPVNSGSTLVDFEDSRWERFSTSNVEIRVGKKAIKGCSGASQVIEGFANQIEEMLKGTP